MSDLTREQIEEIRKWFMRRNDLEQWVPKIDVHSLCDMALRTLDAEDREQAAQENWSREVEHLGERAEQAERERDEAVALLRHAREEILHGDTGFTQRIDALLRRVGGEK